MILNDYVDLAKRVDAGDDEAVEPFLALHFDLTERLENTAPDKSRLSRFTALLALYRNSIADACAEDTTGDQRAELLQQADDAARQMTEMIR